MVTQTVSKPVSIQHFVADLKQFPQPAFDLTGDILAFLQNNPVAPDTLAPYLTWDRQHYTRNLIDKTALYELLAICWEVGQSSSVHNHRQQNCWMAVPSGRLRVENYHLVSEKLDEGTCHLEVSDTLEMNPAVRHLRGVFPGARNLRRDQAALQHRVWGTESRAGKVKARPQSGIQGESQSAALTCRFGSSSCGPTGVHEGQPRNRKKLKPVGFA
jgi:hypothetical protein